MPGGAVGVELVVDSSRPPATDRVGWVGGGGGGGGTCAVCLERIGPPRPADRAETTPATAGATRTAAPFAAAAAAAGTGEAAAAVVRAALVATGAHTGVGGPRDDAPPPPPPQPRGDTPPLSPQFSAAAVVLGCGHDFHRPCLARWLAVSPTCPLCVAHVTPRAVAVAVGREGAGENAVVGGAEFG